MIREIKSALAASAFLWAAQGLAPAQAEPAGHTLSPEQVAAQVCEPGKPFVVVDLFYLKTPVQGHKTDVGLYQGDTMDVNGDIRYQEDSIQGLDALHGDVVAAIAGADGRPVIPFQVDALTPEGLASSFRDLAAFLENTPVGQRPAAVIFSQVLPLNLFMAKDELGDKTMKITPENIHEPENAARIKGLLFSMLPPRMNPYLHIHQALERIEKLGVPVFVAAGNYGPVPIVNYFSLLPGTYTVGALGRGGEKAEFTNDSALVSLWRKGSITYRQVEGGIDLNNDGHPEFTDDQLSSGPSTAEQYAGKSVAGTVKAVPEILWEQLRQQGSFTTWRLARLLPEGVYPTEDIMKLYGQEMLGQTAFNKRQGVWMHHPSRVILQETPDGLLAVDPDGTGDPRQRASWDATSAAAPNICGS